MKIIRFLKLLKKVGLKFLSTQFIILFTFSIHFYSNSVIALDYSEQTKMVWLWHDDPKLSTYKVNLQRDLAWVETLINKPKIILIIDDIGDNYRLGKRAVDLPVALNLAFLPNTPFAGKLAKYGAQLEHDILLHQPMEATTRPDLLGPGALRLNHSKSDVARLFAENLAQFPDVVGFNNHMGSRLTSSSEHMSWLMQDAKNRNLYFIDSRTSTESVAFDIAKANDVDSLSRDVFLDPQDDVEVVEMQFKRAIRIAQSKGTVVVIGHPYPSTLSVLESELPKMAEQFEWLTLSEYWHFQSLAVALAPYLNESKLPASESISAP